jgi:Mg2+ and Co2+ transporter CorA
MDASQLMVNLPPRSAPQKSEDQTDPRKNLRETVNLILPDGLMIVLAIVMIPLAIIPLFIDLPHSIAQAFHFADYTILGIFVIEYFLKLAAARDIRKYVLNPWHLLDLLVIVLPLFDFLALAGGFGRWSPILRLLRLARVAAVGGRAVDRKIKHHSPEIIEYTPEKPPMNVRVVDRDMDNSSEGIVLNQVGELLNNISQTWIDISSVAESNLDELSRTLGIPRLMLESELLEESYPRIDYFESYSMIFARIADMAVTKTGFKKLSVTRAGLLVICRGQNIITISKTGTGLFSQIRERARKFYSLGEPLVVSVLYTILKYSLEKDSQVINALEQELILMESIPLKYRPPDFLENTFQLKKEVNQLVPSLLHMKEIAAMITSKRVPLEGFQEKHERLFDIIADEATYLKETAENSRDNLLSLIDLYINTTSFELNKVMRMIAVITSLTIIPSLAGLFGSNILGNPWDIQLWQLFGGLIVLMLAGLWVFYRLGWLKG